MIGPQGDGRALRLTPPVRKLHASTLTRAAWRRLSNTGGSASSSCTSPSAKGRWARCGGRTTPSSGATSRSSCSRGRAGRRTRASGCCARHAPPAHCSTPTSSPSTTWAKRTGSCSSPWLVDGRDLSTLIALREPLPLERKLDLVIEVLQGLSYAHERGVIHRDIKPSNVRIASYGSIKIMDFGIARLQSADVTGSG